MLRASHNYTIHVHWNLLQVNHELVCGKGWGIHNFHEVLFHQYPKLHPQKFLRQLDIQYSGDAYSYHIVKVLEPCRLR